MTTGPSFRIQTSEFRIRNANLLTHHPSLVEQAYEAILGEITDGTLAPNTHLVQEALAVHYGVSRQPIQQALLLLKNDGIVQDAGRRGLIVAPLDLDMMRFRYEVRMSLDVLAARLAALRCAGSAHIAERIRRDGEHIVAAGMHAVRRGDVKDMVARDVAFHGFVYEASGNPVIGPTAEVLWRYLRRVMGEVLRRAQPPPRVWEQHRAILDAIIAGDAAAAVDCTETHIKSAADRLIGAARTESEQVRKRIHVAQQDHA